MTPQPNTPATARRAPNRRHSARASSKPFSHFASAGRRDFMQRVSSEPAAKRAVQRPRDRQP